jgi:methylamine dehydrogenase heavy chain
MHARSLICAAVLLGVAAPAAPAGLPEIGGVATVPAPGPHWFWADDLSLMNDIDGRAFLLDADDGHLYGMLGTGVLFAKLDMPADYHVIYSAETYYSRGGRGTRTDVITLYDPTTLAPTGEIEIPARRQTGVPPLALSGLTDDDRFLLVYNFNPAQSVTIVDLAARKVAGEISTPGCALVFPSGARRFGMLCQDGSWQTLSLGEDGGEAGRAKSQPFFDPAQDLITEKGVRLGAKWLFASRGARLYAVDVSEEAPAFVPAWSLLSDAERKQSWTVGGTQHLSVHASSGRLYSLMHRGGADTHKDPGTEVWVYDVAKAQRLQRIRLRAPAITVLVTQDDAPLLITSDGGPKLEVYDARSGAFRRAIAGVGQTPLLLQNLPGPSH